MAVTTTTDGIKGVVEHLCNRILRLRKMYTPNSRKRILIALAGVPGSGKSTISEALFQTLWSRNVYGVRYSLGSNGTLKSQA